MSTPGTPRPATPRLSQKRRGQSPGARHNTTPGPGEYNQDYRTIQRTAVDRAWRAAPHRSAMSMSRGTMTDHATLEEEIAQLQARINILVRAGVDYRSQVDQLFSATRSEAQSEIEEKAAMIKELERTNSSLVVERDRLRALLGEAQDDINTLSRELERSSRDIEVANAKADAALAAQRRVEAEFETTAERQHKEREELHEARRKVAQAEEEVGALKTQLAATQQQLSQRTHEVGEATQRLKEVASLTEDKLRLQKECDSMAAATEALREKNNDLEAKYKTLRDEASLMPSGEEIRRLRECETALRERLQQQETSNRVLHREVDRRKQDIDELTRRLKEEETRRAVLEEQVSVHISEASLASRTVHTALPKPRLHDVEVHCMLVGESLAILSDDVPLEQQHSDLLHDYKLLLDEREHERHEDEQVRQLCEELHTEVTRLASDNMVLKKGLSMIEETFGKFLTPEIKERLGDAIPHDDAGEEGVEEDTRAAWLTREAFTQTRHDPLLSTASPPRSVRRGEEYLDAHRDVSHRVAVLEAERAALQKQLVEEREALGEAFREKVQDLLHKVSTGQPIGDVVRVDISVGPTRNIHTPASPNPALDTVPCEGAHDILRRSLAEADTMERQAEAAVIAAKRLAEENDDCREQIRRLVSADSTARTAHAIVASTLHAAERRINDHLNKYKAVLRGRAQMIQKVVEALHMTADAREAAREVALHLRGQVPREAVAYLHQLVDLLEEAKVAHRTIVHEYMTDWEKTAAGFTSAKRGRPDLVNELRALEDFVASLWVTITIPTTPRRVPHKGMRMYAALSDRVARPVGGEGERLASGSPPTVTVGSPSPQSYSETSRSPRPRSTVSQSPRRSVSRRAHDTRIHQHHDDDSGTPTASSIPRSRPSVGGSRQMAAMARQKAAALANLSPLLYEPEDAA